MLLSNYSITDTELLLTNLFKVLGELLFKLDLPQIKLLKCNTKKWILQVFGKTAKNLKFINVSKSHWQNSHVYQRLYHAPLHYGSKTKLQPALFRTVTELPLTSDLFVIVSGKVRINSQIHTRCFLQYYIYMYRWIMLKGHFSLYKSFRATWTPLWFVVRNSQKTSSI